MQRDSKSDQFFAAAARDELVIKRCAGCAQSLPPESAVCTSCASTELTWDAAAGTGTLVTWTVVHKPPNGAFADLVPYTVGIVELTEGPWLYARIDSEKLSAGVALTATFVHPADGESYPVFA